MYRLSRSNLMLFSTALQAFASIQSNADCKCTPSDLCWPSIAEFRALNESVDGNLIQAVPPGSVCYRDQPDFDETKCQHVRDNWMVSTFHANDPISIGFPQWANNSCPPLTSDGTSLYNDSSRHVQECKLGGYPVYSLNATGNASHIQEVVRFADRKNIRLNIKSTGHSFQGRSTSSSSISVWTHNLRGITYEPDFRASPNSQGVSAFRIAAGERDRDVYEAANKYNRVVVGGSAQDVGIVGWFTGGGHGPLSSTYGMGVDNVLQVTVVTPTGDLVSANEYNHPDLLWAIRGGGGGTFGVITEVVMRSHPAEPMESTFFSLEPPANSTNDTDTFFDASSCLLSQFPDLKRQGLSGYTFLNVPGLSPGYSFTGSLAKFGAPPNFSIPIFTNLTQHLKALYPTMNFTTTTTTSPNFFTSWNSTIGFEPVGGGPYNILLGSRLLPSSSLTTSPSQLSSTLKNLSTLSTGPIQFYLVANSSNRNLNISLNPAWRDAVVHTIITSVYPANATAREEKEARDRLTFDMTGKLKGLAPESGAYFNEGDPFDPNWSYTYFGKNYERLRAVKRRYDPNSTLWCLACVGSEGYVQDGRGRLCKVEWERGGRGEL